MLRNARDAERRVLCPSGKPIVDDDVIPIDRFPYHWAGWRIAGPTQK